ncbi:TPA: DNA-binding protein [Streptococcus agalactiae]|uniref:hypothetical protein n=1 Tax=Streptococcus agalactiae TaxID=1311 RepID=UPI0002BBB1C7|nr:hypothetical protein [Streptococcus agalactiae]QBX29973.1 hypothetical protein Javan52_0054 [Streptococcus phage Javan52]EMC0663002.1 DNA-binding protein [Streptococcus agalactiae]EPT90586.1 hypothetical protein SAG0104_04530 [Streptococcus agalactiae BSU178]EPV90203.1 hypothetical protein SAG0014_11025 [Streptococcus agalactiae FSL S3-586]EPX14693.1 hypothetical protein SAG0192_06050 [Streptococcus agalactiae str. Gottschalk 1002A]
MDDLLEKLYEQFESGLRIRAVNVIQSVSNEKTNYPLELTKTKVSEMLGVSPETFDRRFNSHEDFPRIKGNREKYPRDKVIEWYNENYMRTGV